MGVRDLLLDHIQNGLSAKPYFVTRANALAAHLGLDPRRVGAAVNQLYTKTPVRGIWVGKWGYTRATTWCFSKTRVPGARYSEAAA